MSTAFQFDPNNSALVLEHPLVDAEWRWNESGAMVCSKLTYRPSNSHWLSPSTTSPLYQLDWKHRTDDKQRRPPETNIVIGTHAHSVAAPEIRSDPDGVARASIALDPTDTPLRLTWHVESHPNHAAIRQWFTVTNVGDVPIVITRLPIMTVSLAEPDGAPLTGHCGLDRRHYLRRDEWPDWFTWRQVNLRPGVVEAVRAGYRQEATWLGLTSHNDGPGLYLGWESNSLSVCDFGDVHGDGGVWSTLR